MNKKEFLTKWIPHDKVVEFEHEHNANREFIADVDSLLDSVREKGAVIAETWISGKIIWADDLKVILLEIAKAIRS